MSQRNAAMLALVAAHLTAAVIVGWVAEDGEPTFLLAIYVGLTFSQTSLLGIWGGFSPQHWLLRICGLAVGIAFLGPAFDWGLHSDLLRVSTAAGLRPKAHTPSGEQRWI